MPDDSTTIVIGTITSVSSGPSQYPGTQVPGFDNPTVSGTLYERCNVGNINVPGVVGGYTFPSKIRVPPAILDNSPWNGTAPDFLSIVVVNLGGVHPGTGNPCVETYRVYLSKVSDDGVAYPGAPEDNSILGVITSSACVADERLSSNCVLA